MRVEPLWSERVVRRVRHSCVESTRGFRATWGEKRGFAGLVIRGAMVQERVGARSGLCDGEAQVGIQVRSGVTWWPRCCGIKADMSA